MYQESHSSIKGKKSGTECLVYSVPNDFLSNGEVANNEELGVNSEAGVKH